MAGRYKEPRNQQPLYRLSFHSLWIFGISRTRTDPSIDIYVNVFFLSKQLCRIGKFIGLASSRQTADHKVVGSSPTRSHTPVSAAPFTLSCLVPGSSPAGTRRNNNVLITSKLRRRRRFDIMKTLSLRHFCVMCPLGPSPLQHSILFRFFADSNPLKRVWANMDPDRPDSGRKWSVVNSATYKFTRLLSQSVNSAPQ